MQYKSAVSIIKTDIPARLERLPWARFHTLVVGREVTLTGAVSGALKRSTVLRFHNAEVGLAASIYLAGLIGGVCCLAG